MARAYPSAGFAFTCTGRELNRRAGYLVGWSMVMDYLLCPILCVICSCILTTALGYPCHPRNPRFQLLF